MFITLLVCVALLAVIRNVYPGRVRDLIRVTFNERLTQQVMREEMVFSHRASWILLGISGLSLALLAVLSARVFGMDYGIQEFWWISALLAIGFLCRQFLRIIVQALSGRDIGLLEFNFVSAAIYKVLGLIMLPMGLLMAFLPISVAKSGAIVLALILLIAALYRSLRAWWIGRSRKQAFIYLIFYLCAFEWIPTLVVAKALVSNIQNL